MANDKKIVSLDDADYELLKEDTVRGKHYYLMGSRQDNESEYITGTIKRKYKRKRKSC